MEKTFGWFGFMKNFKLVPLSLSLRRVNGISSGVQLITTNISLSPHEDSMALARAFN